MSKPRWPVGVSVVAFLSLLGVAVLLHGSGPVYDRISLVRAQLGMLAGAIDAFQLDNSRPPIGLIELIAPGPASIGPYAKERQLRDPWGREYYFRPGEDGSYLLFSLGSDGQLGGSGSAADVQLIGPLPDAG